MELRKTLKGMNKKYIIFLWLFYQFNSQRTLFKVSYASSIHPTHRLNKMKTFSSAIRTG
jgi:hypothetical protein